MPVNIDFDQDWNSCHHPTTDDDNLFISSLTDTVEGLRWSLITLPHDASLGEEHTNNELVKKWWYRKQFEWISSGSRSLQSIDLTFQLLSTNGKDNCNSTARSILTDVWLNAVQIFSGFIRGPQTTIHLPQQSLQSNQAEDHNQKYTLIVCCKNASLSFHATLTVPHGTISVDNEVQSGLCVENGVDVTETRRNTHDYVTSFDDIDGRDDAVNDLKQRLSTSTQNNQEYSDFLEINQINKKDVSEEKVKQNGCSNHVEPTSIPLLTIVMLIVGSRGDVQPFIAFGKALRAVGHRVRLATDEEFRNFVRKNGLEFFPLARGQAEIMSFMVKNSGIIPSFSSVVSGNVFKQRYLFSDILESTWSACTSDDDETGAPFRAEAIIANPISYGHIHCAQKLGIPLHMAFTMPYSPTTAFPHPLASIDYSKDSRAKLNKFSYSMVETLMWIGIGGLINDFRQKTLDLPSLHMWQATSMMADERVPHTYCWSPSLVPKPTDWPFYIDVSGFFFLDLPLSEIEPPADLLAFLGLESKFDTRAIGISAPIFIGFGSITGHDSRRLLKTILDALAQAGYRALLAGFDIDNELLPETIFKLESISYDWLFRHVSAVCHHGGAGTTATALRAGKPPIILPFFGDQFFWGNVVEKLGAGPSPIPGKEVTVEQLVEAFKFAHKPEVRAAAQRIREDLLREDGCATAVRSFHANLPISRIRSDLEPTFAACFRLDEFNMQVSRPVAQVLLSAGLVEESQFCHHVTRDWQSTHDSSSESDIVDRPHHDDFQLNVEAIRSSMTHDSNNNVSDSGSRPQVHKRRRRNSGSPSEPRRSNISSAIKNVNMIQRVSFGTRQPAASLPSASSDDPNDLSALVHDAANISGFTPEVCQRIITEFSTLKAQRMQRRTLASVRNHRMYTVVRQRSQSVTDL